MVADAAPGRGQACVGQAHLEDLPIPLHVVAVDVITGEKLLLSVGSAVDAVRRRAPADPHARPPAHRSPAGGKDRRVMVGDRSCVQLRNNTAIAGSTGVVGRQAVDSAHRRRAPGGWTGPKARAAAWHRHGSRRRARRRSALECGPQRRPDVVVNMLTAIPDPLDPKHMTRPHRRRRPGAVRLCRTDSSRPSASASLRPPSPQSEGGRASSH